MIRRLRVWPATLLAIVVVSLAGCSSSDDAAEGAAPASSAATAAPAAATATAAPTVAAATAAPTAAAEPSAEQIYLDTATLLLNRLAEQSLLIAEAIVDPDLGSDAWNASFAATYAQVQALSSEAKQLDGPDDFDIVQVQLVNATEAFVNAASLIGEAVVTLDVDTLLAAAEEITFGLLAVTEVTAALDQALANLGQN